METGLTLVCIGDRTPNDIKTGRRGGVPNLLFVPSRCIAAYAP
jgi:hypothetical protein